ncbi:MAG TPA: lipopolysaccharide biosynthesis protein, partial [Pyrinomonadaceae bacterium]
MPQEETTKLSTAAPPADADKHFRTDHLRAGLGRRTARGGALMMGSQGFKFVLNMLATVVLARLLTPQDYGLIGMVIVVTNFADLFRSLGLSAATVQKEDVSHAQVSTLFWINLAFGALTMLLTAAASPAVARFYAEPRLVPVTVAFAVTFLFGGLVVQHEAVLRRQMRFGVLATLELVSMLAGIVVAVVMAARGAGYWALVFNQLVLNFLYAAGVWLACGWRPSLPSKAAGVRSMLAFGGNITASRVLNFFARNLDNMLIGRYWGAQSLGLYAKAYQLLLLPLDQITGPLDGVVVPALSRLGDSPERYRRAYLRILEKVAMLTMPGIAFMIATSDWLVRVVLGPQWGETARVFAWLGLTGLLEPIGIAGGWALISQGRKGDILRLSLIHAPIAILSIVAGLPWGAVGVAAAYSTVGLLVRKPLVFWFVGREGPVRASDIYRAIAPSSCAALCVMAALFLFRRWAGVSEPLWGLAACFAIACGVALFALAALPAGRLALRDA